MTLQIMRLRDNIRSSLWFIPSVLVVLAFILAEAALRFDKSLDRGRTDWFLFGGGIDSARVVVATIATSMLTFTGLVFTITMLVLQLASNQLSPRVMRTFLRDRSNQIVLGTFVATFVYALLVLRRITNQADGDPFVPALSVWLGMVLVLFSIGLFIYYIHHMAQSIRPSSVMARVAGETYGAIDRLYPAGIGADALNVEALDLPAATAIVFSPGPSGVLTGLDESRIADVARETGCLIELLACVGDYVREGTALFSVSGDLNARGSEILQSAVSFAGERTMEQDAAFGFRQLVDIGERALSPGINDPSTAVQAIDQLQGLLGRLVVREIPSPVRKLDDETYVIMRRPAWPDYVALTCDEIRRAGRGQIQIQRRLRAMLKDLLDVAPESRKRPLQEQLSLLDDDLNDAYHGAERVRAMTPSGQGQGPAFNAGDPYGAQDSRSISSYSRR